MARALRTASHSLMFVIGAVPVGHEARLFASRLGHLAPQGRGVPPKTVVQDAMELHWRPAPNCTDWQSELLLHGMHVAMLPLLYSWLYVWQYPV